MRPIGNLARDRSQVATAVVEDSLGESAFLSVAVCAEGEAGATWDDANLECALARDMILASGGIPSESSGSVFVARFNSVASAATAARRLQWSAQGFSEGSHPRALSILIQSGEEVAGQGLTAPPFEDVANGSIRVTDAAARLLEDTPGFSVRPKEGGAEFREISWQAAANLTTREADEQVLARMIEQNGRVSEAMPEPEAPPEVSPVLSSALTDEERRPSSHAWLWIGLAVVLIAGAAAGYYFLRPGAEQKTAATVPAQQIPAPSETATVPAGTTTAPSETSSAPAASTPAPEKEGNKPQAAAPTPPLTRAQKREEQRKQKAQAAAAAVQPAAENTPPPQPAAPEPKPQDSKAAKQEVSGNCLYSSDQIPGLLDLAEASRGRGQYKEARRKLQAVLNCDRGNARARALLEQVQRAEAAQGGSPDPQ